MCGAWGRASVNSGAANQRSLNMSTPSIAKSRNLKTAASKKRSVKSRAPARRKVTSAATTAKVPPKSDEPKVEQVIRRVHLAHRGRYGAPRIYAALRARGYMVSRGRVERLMRHQSIRAITPRRFRICTTDSHHDLPIAPNRLDQKFTAERPNQVWLADITYVPTEEGWLYLAVVLDLFTRKSSAGRCVTTCGQN